MQNEMSLQDFFLAHKRCAVAFSGGTDSAYLLYAARRCGADVAAYYVKSAFQPAFEFRDAEAIAERLQIPLTVLNVDVLQNPDVVCNDAQRCYYCKRTLFQAVLARAEQDGRVYVLDGTNASDDSGERPGMRALRELGVLSPLRLAGLTKAEIRRCSREAGLPSADKPAYACLATRIPTGTPVQAETLARVEAAEDALFAAGLTDFRVRVREYGALLQLCEKDRTAYSGCETELMRLIAPWFPVVRIDEAVRKGE